MSQTPAKVTDDRSPRKHLFDALDSWLGEPQRPKRATGGWVGVEGVRGNIAKEGEEPEYVTFFANREILRADLGNEVTFKGYPQEYKDKMPTITQKSGKTHKNLGSMALLRRWQSSQEGQEYKQRRINTKHDKKMKLRAQKEAKGKVLKAKKPAAPKPPKVETAWKMDLKWNAIFDAPEGAPWLAYGRIKVPIDSEEPTATTLAPLPTTPTKVALPIPNKPLADEEYATMVKPAEEPETGRKCTERKLHFPLTRLANVAEDKSLDLTKKWPACEHETTHRCQAPKHYTLDAKGRASAPAPYVCKPCLKANEYLLRTDREDIYVSCFLPLCEDCCAPIHDKFGEEMDLCVCPTGTAEDSQDWYDTHHYFCGECRSEHLYGMQMKKDVEEEFRARGVRQNIHTYGFPSIAWDDSRCFCGVVIKGEGARPGKLERCAACHGVRDIAHRPAPQFTNPFN